MSDHIFPGRLVANAMTVAVRNTCRTALEQAALLELAEIVNPISLPWVDWVDQVHSTWASSPCVTCGDEAPAGERYCERCEAEELQLRRTAPERVGAL